MVQIACHAHGLWIVTALPVNGGKLDLDHRGLDPIVLWRFFTALECLKHRHRARERFRTSRKIAATRARSAELKQILRVLCAYLGGAIGAYRELIKKRAL